MTFITPPQLAQQIYDYLKQKITNIPDFWSEVTEENKEFLVFNVYSDTSMEKYFNDQFQRVAFNINLMLKKDNKINQFNMINKIINTIINYREGENWKAIQMKINDTYIQNETDITFITYNELDIYQDTQTASFSISYLLEKKEDNEDKQEQ